MVELIRINSDNFANYQLFDSFDNLSEFQSRIYPNEDSEIVNWYYIKVDGNFIGSVWLEKQSHELFAVLGIFIAKEEYRGKGIGKQAIKAIISAHAKDMKVDEIRLNVREKNARAIRCYTDCGFVETQRYKNETGISAISMCCLLKT